MSSEMSNVALRPLHRCSESPTCYTLLSLPTWIGDWEACDSWREDVAKSASEENSAIYAKALSYIWMVP